MNMFIELSVILILGGCNVQKAPFNHSNVKPGGECNRKRCRHE